MDKYEIFRKCFPELDTSEDMFNKLAKVDHRHCIEYEEDGQLVGYVVIENVTLNLICVFPEYQRRGIGSMLLDKAESYIKSIGHTEILIGGTSSRFLIGAIERTKGFFEKHGYETVGNCDEMKQSMHDFIIDDYEFSAPPNVRFGWYEGSIEDIRSAVAEVEPDWVRFYNEDCKVFCGWQDDEICSFCIVRYDGECILSNGYNKVGEVGCVGTVPKHRRKGIGLKMVALASEELKKNECDLCFIHYTGVPEWYEKIGYETFLKIYFMKKEI